MKLIALLFVFLLSVSQAVASEVIVAVAANFYQPMQVLAADFEKSSGNKVVLSTASTRALATQIQHGAPFELFLAADQVNPQQLITAQLAVKSSRFTYAQGRLALWSPQEGLIDSKGAILASKQLSKLAIANPKTAPYGAAAMEVIAHLGLSSQLSDKLVEGQSISQTYRFISSGTVPLGFVALSQIIEQGKLRSGSVWLVPENLYSPMDQDAVLLTKGQHNQAAKDLLIYLQSAQAKALIRSFGYHI